MNTDNRLMERVAKAQNEQAFREQSRLTVANQVLGYLEPENCRSMALGIADMLTYIDLDGVMAQNAVNQSGWAISTLMRVAEMQDEAEIDARLKARRKEKGAEKAEAVKSTIELEGEPVELESELVSVLRETVRDLENTLVSPRGLLQEIDAQREAGHE